MQRMKESKTIKEYSYKLLSIANKVRLLDIEFSDSRIVEKILVTVPERYEASITTLENTKDLSKITLAGVLHALQAQEQQRLMRQDHVVEGALQAKHREVGTTSNNQRKDKGKKRSYPPCEQCDKMGHPSLRCWRRPYAKCSKCNQIGHEAAICKGKFQQLEVNAQVVEQDEEDKKFCGNMFFN